jgi:Ser-tRNA(Ala) deacylase AlaX
MASTSRTFLAFQHDAKLQQIETTVISVRSFSALEESNRQVFKNGSDEHYIVVTDKTIFHPQGGGQPFDVGTMTGNTGHVFTVTAVRMDLVCDGQVMHLGLFASEDAALSVSTFKSGETVQQAIDVDKRLLYSRLHTAGHVLGASVRHLVKSDVKDFAELKASHFPGAAACEFQGLIDGKWKDAIQKKVDDSIAAKLPVSVEWWDESDFRTKGLDYLLPDRSLVAPGEKFRMVNIGGLDVYPCGGTHVETTDLCGHTTVKKITRKQGQSKVSYSID